MISLYVHMPFCVKKCAYCDFNSYAQKEHLIARYCAALQKEITLLPLEKVQTIYIGGGTPSLIKPNIFKKFMGKLRYHCDIQPDAEFTLEVNPESVTREKLNAWYTCGVNRISIGLQAVDETHLKFLGRIHDYSQFIQTYSLARSQGFNNINIDVLYGYPGLSFSAWKQTIHTVLSLQPEHLSLYALSVEEHTPLYDKHITLDDDNACEQYNYAVECLKKAGLPRYEISNFAVPGKESSHNQAYWTGVPYFGIGAGAASYYGQRRWKNISDIKRYIEHIEQGEPIIEEEEIIDNQKKITENIFLGLRRSRGIECGPEEEAVFNKKLYPFITAGLLEYNKPILKLTDKGVLLSNQIFRSLF